MNKIMISVVIPLYNKQDSVAHTLECVLNQTFPDFEVVVVDDGSKDQSAAVVERFTDARIRLIKQKNGGVSAARNRGIAEARGEYVAFLDADDEWKSDYLSSQMELVRKYPQCSVFASNYEFRNIEGKMRNTIINKLPFAGTDGELSNYFEVACCSHPPLWTSAVMVRKTAIQEIGGFLVGIKSGEDLLTWAKLAVKFKIAYCKEPLAVFNVLNDKITEKPKRIPADFDCVGQELLGLYKLNPGIKGLKSYIALWHKMRSSIYMRLKMRRKSISEALKSIRYNPWNYKLYINILINIIPH